jgi:hypothetical protein
LRNNSFYATYVNGRLEMDLLRVTWNKANNKKKNSLDLELNANFFTLFHQNLTQLIIL